MSRKEWPLWEVFIRGQHGLNHRHVGSLHASDAEMAIHHARDVYTRRKEGRIDLGGEIQRHHRIEPVGERAAVRSGREQGLSPSDLL